MIILYTSFSTKMTQFIRIDDRIINVNAIRDCVVKSMWDTTITCTFADGTIFSMKSQSILARDELFGRLTKVMNIQDIKSGFQVDFKD
jgi:hypothetical protein